MVQTSPALISLENMHMVVLEYMANGDLKTYLQQHARPVTRLVKFMNDIVMGMHHLSELGLVHRVSSTSQLDLGLVHAL